MLKSFVCDLNVHRLFKRHYCYLANLFRGSSALQDGPVGRTALASKLEHVPVELGSGHAEGLRGAATLFLLKSTLQSMPSPAVAFVWCILEGFVVGSPKADCMELLFESV